MLEALDEHFPPARPSGRARGGGLFIWATLPDYIDTTDLLARALRDHVAFVPGRAAYLDGRGGSSMRLNFSGVGEDDLREGVRRIGKVVARAGPAVLDAHGRSRRHPPPRRRRAGASRRRRADAARRRADGARRTRIVPAAAPGRRRSMSRVAVLEGGQLARAPGVAALGRARAGRARARSATT